MYDANLLLYSTVIFQIKVLPNIVFSKSPNINPPIFVFIWYVYVCLLHKEYYISTLLQLISYVQIVHGVKGFSPFHLMPSFDVIQCVPVDYMHCVMLGVVKKLASLWFKSTYHQDEWCLCCIAIC